MHQKTKQLRSYPKPSVVHKNNSMRLVCLEYNAIVSITITVYFKVIESLGTHPFFHTVEEEIQIPHK